uniref:Reverse transcriptase domain-containing protein n=1 Tax=Tanacetum cinerariifolium TaxID=118510 RepID=A0A6L2KYD9_TANCI|nr:reverse transcriptase domain-containing protein [Tanacetum cinerariifolium]
MSTNEIRGVCHVGFGQGHMGRSGRGHGYYSCVCVCAQESWGEGMGVLARKLELSTEIADTIVESIPSLPIPVLDSDSQREEIDIVTETDDVLPLSVENNDDSSNDPLLEEADLFLSDNSIPSGIENSADDPKGDIHFLEELLIDDSILSHESSDSNSEDNPSIPQPPPKPPNVESFHDLKPDVIAEEIPDKLNEDKCFDPGREINVSTKIEDDDYFLSYLIFPEVSPLFLFAESEDTIFDPALKSYVECVIATVEALFGLWLIGDKLCGKAPFMGLYLFSIKLRTQVLLFNSRLKIFSGKLKSRWSGPYTIAEIYPYGTAKLIHPDGCNFKVNCHRLKHYHGGDLPPLEIPDVTTFPKDN